MHPMDKHVVKEPDIEYGRYTYADYLTWEMDEMVELIRGKIFKRAAAAPGMNHQRVSVRLTSSFFNFLKGKTCQVFHAPYDVRLPIKSKKNQDIDTVVQPDLCVICDPIKLTDAGCLGAPDLVVEILSQGNNKRELKHKYEVYEESGIKEYWVIHPNEQTLLVYSLDNGKYKSSRLFVSGDIFESVCVPGLRIDMDELFEE